jgi:hypothetical protein
MVDRTYDGTRFSRPTVGGRGADGNLVRPNFVDVVHLERADYGRTVRNCDAKDTTAPARKKVREIRRLGLGRSRWQDSCEILGLLLPLR